MSKNKKQLIIESFQNMNLNMLEVLLDDNRTYQGASKEVFLKKISDAFHEFKSDGDTFLEAFNGVCTSNLCPNKGCKGYSFIGNMTNNHIDLIFEEEDEEIIEIYHCNSFSTDNVNINREKLISIDIMDDERVGYKPSVEFLILVQKCKKAYDELMAYKNEIIDKKVYFEWLEKFKDLFESDLFFHYNVDDYNNFNTLYFNMKELKEFLQSDNSAKDAIIEFEELDKTNEIQFLKWLTKYEETSDKLVLFLNDDIDFEEPEKTTFFTVKELKISTSDFKNIARFKFLYDEPYWDFFKKYTTISNEELTRLISQKADIPGNINSLSYHLEKRGIRLK